MTHLDPLMTTFKKSKLLVKPYDTFRSFKDTFKKFLLLYQFFKIILI